MTLTIGQVLQARYRIDGLVRPGGMGAVYRATDLHFGSTVAVKENLDLSPEGQQQFAREAGILYHLRHPSLPRVTDYFGVPGLGQYLVMDYVVGPDLEQIVAQYGRLPEAQALSYLAPVLDALEFLHAQQPPIIHRDVKPPNVKVTPQGRVLLVDLGVAKVYQPPQATAAAARRATPGYAPPEQYGYAPTDARSDVYSAGATLYNLLTGTVPPSSVELLAGSAVLPPPRQLSPALTRRTEEALLKAMELLPGRRFQTIAGFRAALGLGHRRAAAPPWAVAALAVLLVALAMAALILGVGGATRLPLPTPATPGTPPLPTASPTASPAGGVIASPIPSPVAAEPAVLWDISHGVYEAYGPSAHFAGLRSGLESQGYLVDENSAGLLHVDLAGYQAIVLCAGSYISRALTPAEAAAVQQFVRAGGGLVVLADQPNAFRDALDPVTHLFGVDTAASALGDSIGDLANHPVFDVVTALQFEKGGSLAVSAPARAVAWDGSGQPAVAVAVDGAGRVVIVGDLNLWTNEHIDGAGNRTFARNVFAWVSARP